MSQRTSVWFPLIVSVALALGLLAGYVIQGRYNEHSPKLIQLGKDSKLDEILGYIDEKYVEALDRDELSEAAIEEVVRSLDPHSMYIPKREMKALQEDMSGNFEGIGIEFFIVDDTIMVVTPLSGGPSEAVGILSGDRIVTIEDSVVAGIGITNSQVVRKLKGPKGTEVTVGIRRFGEPDILEFTIRRDRIPLVSVDVGFMADSVIGYIKINRFSASTYREFMQEMEELEAAGMDKLIIDLRQNPGGFLEEATKMLDEFIDGRKELVHTKGRNHPKYAYTARKPGLFESGKVAVLIDEGSASASEIVAGAIQDWDRGAIIGRRSFGKGLVQEQYALQDGSALRLTVAKYYTPSGRCIQKPYDRDHAELYDEDLTNRLENGELFSGDSIRVADSLVYFTRIENRKVYGGGGITPDIFVPFDTLGYDKYYNALARRGLIRQYAYDYFSGHRSDFGAYAGPEAFNEGFEVPASVLESFFAFASAQGVEKPASLAPEVLTAIRDMLKASIAKQLWNGDGYYPVMLRNDKAFRAALDYLRSEASTIE